MTLPSPHVFFPRAATHDEQSAELRRATITGLVVLAALNIADVVLTGALIDRGGVELNPIADAMIASGTTLVAKLLIIALLGAHILRRGPQVITLCLLWLVTGIYAAVVILNGSQLDAVTG
jgi:hypothetical protein